MKENIIFKATKEMKDQLKKEAKEKGLTMSGYIKIILANRNN